MKGFSARLKKHKLNDLPELIRVNFRHYISDEYRYAFRFHYPFGYARFPKSINIKITNRCNLNCAMCGQTKSRRDTWQKDELPARDWIRMIESVARHNPFISIWGGEPLMYDGIMDVIDTAHKHDLRVGMITNGIYLKKYASQLAKYDNFSLGISLDGPPLIHDKVRGRTGTFINLVEGVNAFNGQRRKLGKQPKRVSIIFSTVTQDNMYRIEDLIKTAEQFCPDAMYISYLTFVTRDMIDATNRIFQHKFGITYSSLESFNIDVSGYDIAHLEEMTRKMNNKQFTDKFNVHFNPHIKPEDVRRYYTDTRYAMGRQTCYRPWFIAEMLPNGQMNFCPDFPDYKFGDIRKESFADIWNGKQARRFRRLLKKKKLFPMCYRCCGLLTHQPRSVLNP